MDDNTNVLPINPYSLITIVATTQGDQTLFRDSSINVFGSVDVSYSDRSYVLLSPVRSDFLVNEQSFCSAIDESV